MPKLSGVHPSSGVDTLPTHLTPIPIPTHPTPPHAPQPHPGWGLTGRSGYDFSVVTVTSRHRQPHWGSNQFGQRVRPASGRLTGQLDFHIPPFLNGTRHPCLATHHSHQARDMTISRLWVNYLCGGLYPGLWTSPQCTVLALTTPPVFEPGLIAYSESRASTLTNSAKGSDPLARGLQASRPAGLLHCNYSRSEIVWLVNPGCHWLLFAANYLFHLSGTPLWPPWARTWSDRPQREVSWS